MFKVFECEAPSKASLCEICGCQTDDAVFEWGQWMCEECFNNIYDNDLEYTENMFSESIEITES